MTTESLELSLAEHFVVMKELSGLWICALDGCDQGG